MSKSDHANVAFVSLMARRFQLRSTSALSTFQAHQETSVNPPCCLHSILGRVESPSSSLAFGFKVIDLLKYDGVLK